MCRILLIAASAIALASCATTGTTTGFASGSASARSSSPVESALSQPFRDLSLVREQTPPAILRAEAAPYGAEFAASGAVDCAAVRGELAELDAVLGPDVDTAAASQLSSSALAGEAVRSVVSLPYRGAVRVLTGAAARDRRRAVAVLASVARRGFLKGAALTAHCP